MNIEGIKALVTSKGARQLLLARKHSPKMLFVAGTVGVVGTVVLACRATLKVGDKLDELDGFKARLDKEPTEANFTEEDRARLLRTQKFKTGLEIGKLYAPAFGLGVASIAALTGSHVILTKRNGALMTAYVGLDRAYKAYRERVREEYGEEIDKKFTFGAEDISVEEKLANGNTKTTKKTVVKADGKHGRSPYAVLYDETSRFFSREPGRNAEVLGMKQSYANDKLRNQGHLFLNEVLDMLGLPRTEAGQFVGWVYDPHNKEHVGDGYVTFNIFEGAPEVVDAFVAGEHNMGIWLDFNVDGPIYNLI